MKRPRVTLSVLLSVFASSLSAARLVDPPLGLAGDTPAVSSAPYRVAALRIVPARDFQTRDLEPAAPVIFGDLSALAQDVRHSTGLELARQINEESDGLIAAGATVVADPHAICEALFADLCRSLGIESDWRFIAQSDERSALRHGAETPATSITCGPPADATIGAGVSAGCGPGATWPGCGELSTLPRQTDWAPVCEPNPSDMPYDCGYYTPSKENLGCEQYAQAEQLAAYPELEPWLVPAAECFVWLAAKGGELADGAVNLVRLATRWADQNGLGAYPGAVAQPAPVRPEPRSADNDWQYLGL